jgi:hypothetical protein
MRSGTFDAMVVEMPNNLTPTAGVRSEYSHADFLEKLRLSDKGTWAIAKYLKSWGYRVEVAELQEAPTHQDWSRYSDKGDLFVTIPGDERIRCEARYIQSNFTNGSDWPFRPHFMAYNVRSYERADPKPEYVFYVNKRLTHTALLSIKRSRDDWDPRPVVHGKAKIKHPVYFVPMHHLKWFALKHREA